MAIIKKSQTRTQTSITPLLYSDVYTNLNVHPNKQDIALLMNEDAVSRSIKNILLTDKGERFFNPLLGSDIKSLLFENMAARTDELLKQYITVAINNFEPRATLLNVTVTPSYDESAYNVTIVFSTINNTTPITLEFLLNRVR